MSILDVQFESSWLSEGMAIMFHVKERTVYSSTSLTLCPVKYPSISKYMIINDIFIIKGVVS